MKRLIGLVTLIGILGLMVTCKNPEVPADPGRQSGMTRVIVVLKLNASALSARPLFLELGAVVHRQLDSVNAIAVSLPDEAAIARVRSHPSVAYVERDVRVHKIEGPDGGLPTDDPPAPKQITPWGVSRIGADKVWGQTTGAGVKVAVIDTGIEPHHPDLKANVRGGINLVSDDPNPLKTWHDDEGHGTHVAGTIAAVNDDQGVVGVAPQAELYAVKVLGADGSGWTSDVIAGIEWATKHHMRIISMSLGSEQGTQTERDACSKAYVAGLIIIAAAGNEGDGDSETDNVGYPAHYYSAIAVAATDVDDAVAWFSSDGRKVELAAPGVHVYSTQPGDSFRYANGTSMATPHVTGAVALLLAANPKATSGCIRHVLAKTAIDLGDSGRDRYFGYGLIDVPAALEAVKACK